MIDLFNDLNPAVILPRCSDQRGLIDRQMKGIEMDLLAPLEIKEAVEGVIKLTHITGKFATALIPEPVVNRPGDVVDVRIAGKEILSQHPVGELVDGYFQVPIGKENLLNHTGPKKQFEYVYYSSMNPYHSDFIEYDILHS